MKLRYLLYSTLLLSLMSTPYLSSACGCKRKGAQKTVPRDVKREVKNVKKAAAPINQKK